MFSDPNFVISFQSSERWQKKTALLVFPALAFVSAKTKCAVCAVGSFCMAYNGRPAAAGRALLGVDFVFVLSSFYSYSACFE